MARATSSRLLSSCSMVSSAWMPARTFSHTLGTPKNVVGLAAPTTPISSVATGQKCMWLAVATGR